jgi:hypothetical protein
MTSQTAASGGIACMRAGCFCAAGASVRTAGSPPAKNGRLLTRSWLHGFRIGTQDSSCFTGFQIS